MLTRRTADSRWSQLADLLHNELFQLHVRRSFGLSVNRLLPDLVAARSRTALLRLAGLSIGPRTFIGGPLNIVGSDELDVGSDCWINSGCHFDVSARVTIGDRVALAQGVLIITESHRIGSASRRASELLTGPISIGSGCWIGARAVVLPGVTIGAGSVVAAGAVVVDDVAPNTLVGGVPARLIRHLGD